MEWFVLVFSAIRNILGVNIPNNGVMNNFDNLMTKYFSYRTQMLKTFQI